MNRFAHAPAQRTLADIEADLTYWLVSATPAAFDSTDLETLQRRYSRLNPRLVEVKWSAAVARRARERG